MGQQWPLICVVCRDQEGLLAEIMLAKSTLFSGLEKVVNQRPMHCYILQSRNPALANDLTLTFYFSHLLINLLFLFYTGFKKRVVDSLPDLSLFRSQSLLKSHNTTLSFFAWSCRNISSVHLLQWYYARAKLLSFKICPLVQGSDGTRTVIAQWAKTRVTTISYQWNAQIEAESFRQ